MKVLIDDEIIELGRADYLGSGIEGCVYHYFDEAVKIYKSECSKYRLDLKTASSLRALDTKRILLPRRFVYSLDNGEFLGYTTKYISRGLKSEVFGKSVSKFCDELDVLREDINILSSNKVLIEDLILGNTVFHNGNIFLIDPGSYRFIDSPRDDILFSNLWELRDFITYDLLGSVAYSRRRKELIKNMFLADEIDICSIMMDSANKKETVKQYVKRITK